MVSCSRSRPRALSHPAPGGRALGLWIVLAGIVMAAAAGIASDLEHEVKVEFIERFTRFVEWPDEQKGQSKLVIGLIGDSLVARHMEKRFASRMIGRWQPEVMRISSLEQIKSCHLVYISGSERHRLGQILEHSKGLPILTLGDTPGYGAAGVLININREGEYLRFEINTQSARESGLKISSKLMQLAVIVGES